MATTIFKVIKDLEQEDAYKTLSSEAKKALKKLISFVESGTFSNSDIEKYIAKNFRLSAKKLTADYNSKHLSKPKTAETFRSQISRINLSLSSILGIEAEALNDAFVNGDTKVFERIEALKSAFEVEHIDIAERFSLLQGYLPTEASDKNYALEDCERELEVLRLFDKVNIDKYFKGVDYDKLSFLISELAKPLYTRERSAGEKSAVVSIINEDKLALAREFSLRKPKAMKVPDKIVVQAVEATGEDTCKKEVLESTAVDTPINSPNDISKVVDNPYGLDITREMLEAIENWLAEADSENDRAMLKSYSNTAKANAIASAKKDLLALTEDSNIDFFINTNIKPFVRIALQSLKGKGDK